MGLVFAIISKSSTPVLPSLARTGISVIESSCAWAGELFADRSSRRIEGKITFMAFTLPNVKSRQRTATGCTFRAETANTFLGGMNCLGLRLEPVEGESNRLQRPGIP